MAVHSRGWYNVTGKLIMRVRLRVVSLLTVNVFNSVNQVSLRFSKWVS